MTILVIGNGFDIAHDLPTGYPDFLDFIEVYKGKSTDCPHQLKEFIDELRIGKSALSKEVDELLSKRKGLLNHFLNVYTERCADGKDGWIDFERELSDIVQGFDILLDKEKEAVDLGQRSFVPPENLASKLSYVICDGPDCSEYILRKRFPIDFFEEYSKKLLDELNEITRLLEIYLFEYAEKLTVEKKLQDIKELGEIDYVINFNYTDTFQKVYKNCKARCCYIHGKAKKGSSKKDCNLVLGIDEYLDNDRKDNDNRFIWFKKFYQRIYKETGSEYIDWLNEHTKYNNDYCKSAAEVLEVYFYGHSLDVTDKDVLKKLILHENSRIHIFYHKKEAMAKYISNLVNIIGEDNLERMTLGKNRVIEFLPVNEIED